MQTVEPGTILSIPEFDLSPFFLVVNLAVAAASQYVFFTFLCKDFLNVSEPICEKLKHSSFPIKIFALLIPGRYQ